MTQVPERSDEANEEQRRQEAEMLSVNEEERPEDTVRRYARQLAKLEEWLAANNAPDHTEDQIADLVLKALSKVRPERLNSVNIEVRDEEWSTNAQGITRVVAEYAAQQGKLIVDDPQWSPGSEPGFIVLTWPALNLDPSRAVESVRRYEEGREAKEDLFYETVVPVKEWDKATDEEKAIYRNRLRGWLARERKVGAVGRWDQLPCVVHGEPCYVLRVQTERLQRRVLDMEVPGL